MGRPSKPYRDDRGRWRSQIDGKLHYLGRDRGRAFQRFHALMAQVGRPLSDRPLTVAELVGLWLPAQPPDDYWRIRNLVDFVGRLSVDAIEPDVLVSLERRLRRKYAPQTVIHRVRAAERCLRWAHSQGWLPMAPRLPKLRRPVRRPRDVDPAELGAALDDLPECAGRLARFIAATGCRPAEAVRLEWGQVDLRTKTCVLASHKTERTGQPRTLYLTEPAIGILKAIRNRGPVVFISGRGKPYTVAGLRSILSRRMPGLTPYRLRHTFAQLASEQIHEQDLAKLLGHQDHRTTRLYYEVKDRRAIAVAAQLSLPHLTRSSRREQSAKRKKAAAGKTRSSRKARKAARR